ncbi:MAG: sigma-54 dependent transcriptional regulator [Planctomycetota bacterium]
MPADLATAKLAAPGPSLDATAQVLVVDDEVDHAEVMAEALRRLGHVCTLVHGRTGAIEELSHGQFDLVVTDLKMEDDTAGFDVLEAARDRQPQAETIVVTAHGDVPTAIEAVKRGAFDFIEKPVDLDLLRARCTKAIEAVFQKAENRSLRDRLDDTLGFDGLIGRSAAMRQIVTTLKQIAPSDASVLITGESGTGKELIAQAVHHHSNRSGKAFVPLNCAGLSESILEDELFGHVRGAFTGAEKDREGRFEYANHGTLFLDEIGDMPAAMQAKLLRVLESGEVVRLGSNNPRHVDVRLVAATHHDLDALVADGTFREDLFYRLAVVRLHLPPLRDRPDDIPLLVDHFVGQFAEAMNKPAPKVSEAVQRTLMTQPWPGNVRQLRNTVQNLVVMADGDTIEPRHLPPNLKAGDGDASSPGPAVEGAMSLDQLEKQAIRNALQSTSGNREQAAKILGIGERTLYRKLKEYGLK